MSRRLALTLGLTFDARDGLHDGAAVAWAAGHGDGARGQVAGRMTELASGKLVEAWGPRMARAAASYARAASSSYSKKPR